jgi:hypothetical protein
MSVWVYLALAVGVLLLVNFLFVLLLFVWSRREAENYWDDRQ